MSMNDNDHPEVEVSIWFSSRCKDNQELRQVINLSKIDNILSMLKGLPDVSDAYTTETETHLHHFEGKYRTKTKIVLVLSNSNSQVST